MKKILPVVAAAALVITGVMEKAQAIQLASTTLEFLQEASDNSNNQFELISIIQPREIFNNSEIRPFFPSLEDPGIFRGQIFTPQDVGKIFTANKTTDAQFNDYTSLLTNGKKNGIGFFLKLIPSGNGFSQGGLESILTGNPNQVDFFGNTIDSISYQINKIEITPSALGNTRINVQTTWQVFGEPIKSIPESSYVFSLLGMSAFAIGLRQKQKPSKLIG
jgi:hypothetical protein